MVLRPVQLILFHSQNRNNNHKNLITEVNKKMEISISNLWTYIIQASILLASIGAINWGLVGWFDFNLVATLIEALPVGELVELLIYSLIGLGGILGLASFFDLEEL